MYISPAGGCCDCGDLSAWKLQGCCSLHQPGGRTGEQEECTLSQQQRAVAGSIETHLLLLLAWLLLCVVAEDDKETEAAARKLLEFLLRLVAVPPLRQLACQVLAQPPATPLPRAAAHVGAAWASASALQPPVRTTALLQLLEQGDAQMAHSAAGGGGCGDGQQPLQLLACLLWSMARVTPSVMHEMGSLLLLLLYDRSFKLHFATVHWGQYLCLLLHGLDLDSSAVGTEVPDLLVQRKAMQAELDRLLIQVFNVDDITLDLVQDHRLLHRLCSLQAAMLQLASRPPAAGGAAQMQGRLLLEHVLISKQCYLHVSSDLGSVLGHPQVVQHLLRNCAHTILQRHVLGCLEAMQGMTATRRIVSDSSEPERLRLHTALALDLTLNSTLTLQLQASICQAAGGRAHPAFATSTQVELLELAASAGLARLCQWLDQPTQPHSPMLVQDRPAHASRPESWKASMASIYDDLLAGTSSVSVHLPLHRFSAVFLQSLLQMDVAGGEAGRLARASLSRLLQGSWEAAAEAVEKPMPAAWWAAVAHEVLKVQVWMVQVRAQLWARNSDEVQQSEYLYHQPIWRTLGRDQDHLILQVFLACTDPQDLLWCWLSAFGARALTPDTFQRGILKQTDLWSRYCQLMGVSSQSDAAAMLAGLRTYRRQLGQKLAELEDANRMHAASHALQLLVGLLRYRSSCGQQAELRLQHEVIQWLCVQDQGHARLSELVAARAGFPVDSAALDRVLQQVAEFDLGPHRHGRYRLRRELYCRWEPYFLGFPPRVAEAARSRVQAAADHRPEWQLTAPPVLPGSLQGMLGVLTSAALFVFAHSLLYATLQPHGGDAAAGGDGPAPPRARPPPEDLLVPVLNLLSMAAHVLAEPDLLDGALASRGRAAFEQGDRPVITALLSGAGAGEGPAAASAGEEQGIIALLQALQKPSPASGGASHGAHSEQGAGDWARSDRPAVSQELARLGAHVAAQLQPLVPTAAQPAPPAPADAAAQGGADRKAAARRRRQELMAHMARQQSSFLSQAAGACDGDDASTGGKGRTELQSGSEGRNAARGRDPLSGSEPEFGSNGSAASETARGAAGPPGAGAAEESLERGRPGRQALAFWEAATWEQPEECCCVCHEAGGSHGPLGWICQVSMSAVLPQRLRSSPGQQADAAAAPPHLRVPAASELDRRLGLRLHVCGHLMHEHCLRTYCDTRHEVDPWEEGPHTFLRPGAGEFLCPLCRRLGNCLLPVTFHHGAPPLPQAASSEAGTRPAPADLGAAARRCMSWCESLLEKEPPVHGEGPGAAARREASGYASGSSSSGASSESSVWEWEASMEAGADEAFRDNDDDQRPAASTPHSSLLPQSQQEWSAVPPPAQQRQAAQSRGRRAAGAESNMVKELLAQMRRTLRHHVGQLHRIGPAVSQQLWLPPPPLQPSAAHQLPRPGDAGRQREVEVHLEAVCGCDAGEERRAAGELDASPAMEAVAQEVEGLLWSVHPEYEPALLWATLAHGTALWEATCLPPSAAAAAGQEELRSPPSWLLASEWKALQSVFVLSFQAACAGGRSGDAEHRRNAVARLLDGLSTCWCCTAAAATTAGAGAGVPSSTGSCGSPATPPPAAAAAAAKPAAAPLAHETGPLVLARTSSSLPALAGTAPCFDSFQVQPCKRSGSCGRRRVHLSPLQTGLGRAEPSSAPAAPPLSPAAPAAPRPPALACTMTRWTDVVADPYLLLIELLAAGAAAVGDQAWDLPAKSSSSDALDAEAQPPLDIAALVDAAVSSAYAVAVAQAGFRVVVAAAASAAGEPLPPSRTGDALQRDVRRHWQLVQRVVEQLERDRAADGAGDGGTLEALSEALSLLLLPLLRRMLLLRHLLVQARSGAAATSRRRRPAEPLAEPLQQATGGAWGPDASAVQAGGELAAALGLQSPAAALSSICSQPELQDVVVCRWLCHLSPPLRSAAAQPRGAAAVALPAPPATLALLEVPTMYQQLYLQLQSARCALCGRQPKQPALCLLTGRVLCCRDRSCISDPVVIGPCWAHTIQESGGHAVLLLVKSTNLLVLSGMRAAVLPSPFRDEHNEEDLDLRRGRPLTLDRHCWQDINTLWRHGSFALDSATLHASRVFRHPLTTQDGMAENSWY